MVRLRKRDGREAKASEDIFRGWRSGRKDGGGFEAERWEVWFLELVVRFCGVRFGSLHFVSLHFTSSWKPLDTYWNIRVTLVGLFALQPVCKGSIDTYYD